MRREQGVSLSMNILEAGGRVGTAILGGPESGLARERAAGFKEQMDGEAAIVAILTESKQMN